jgi:hypothetical protein
MRIPLTYYVNLNFKKRKNGKTWKSEHSMSEKDLDRIIRFFKNRYPSISIEKKFDIESEDEWYNITLSFSDKADEADFILLASDK